MKAVRWEDAKRQIREFDTGCDFADRVAARERSREELRAEHRGCQLAQLRRELRPDPSADRRGDGHLPGPCFPDRARQDHGAGCGPRLLRGPGGTVDVLAHVGDWTVKVA